VTLEERFLDVPGRLRYLIGGSGPPLLLCHGFMGSAENFETWFDVISRCRTLVIPDLPGCGASAPLPGRHTCAALAGALQPLIAGLGLDRFDLGGLCLGSGVAFEVLAEWPDRVDRLVLHTPLLEPSVVRRRFHRQAAVMTAPGIFPVISWLARRRWVSDLYKRFVVEGEEVDRAAAEANFRNQLRCDPRAQQQWLREGLRRHDAGLLGEHPGESLIIVAGDDRLLDDAALGAVVDAMPRVHHVRVDQAGHGWNEQFVRRQIELVSGFLEGRPLPAAGHAAK
jgi:pimeloyl-ACP methyl ester carboxylesterase